jgi:hypothetical protein
MRDLDVVNSLQNCYVSSERQIGVADAVRDAVRAAKSGLRLDFTWTSCLV